MWRSKHVLLGLVFALASLDAFSTWLLVVFYTTGWDYLWLVNVNFMVLSTVIAVIVAGRCRIIIDRVFRIGDVSLLAVLLVTASVIALINLTAGQVDGADLAARHALTQLYGLGMPLACLMFASQFERRDLDKVHPIMVTFAWCYSVIAFSGVFAYAVFYQWGMISYFGLGTNVHYVLPWLLVSRGPLVLLPVGLLILLSGKRAVLVNFVVQVAIHFGANVVRRPLLGLGLLLGAAVSLILLVNFTPLLDRFVQSISAMSNLVDPDALLVAFGGRGEEVVGIVQYFTEHPGHLLLGVPPGESYRWVVEGSGLDVTKNYAHVTPIGMVFRYGLVFTLVLYGLFVIFLIKYYAPKDPFYLAFVGILSSTAFGANMIVDPTSWLLIGLMLRLSPAADRAFDAQSLEPLNADTRNV